MRLPKNSTDVAPSPFLPAAQDARTACLLIGFVLLALKILTIFHYRVDSDESQHAHVVWALSQGQLQYRDFFDNHTPLFHLALVPLFRLLGERASILIDLRFAMIPIWLFCLWCVFSLTEHLFSREEAPWVTLCAAALPSFFYTSTEFRPDLLWAACWLYGLLYIVRHPWTLARAFIFGLLLGADLGISIKTLMLYAALACALLIAFGLNIIVGKVRPAVFDLIKYLCVIAAGAMIIPGLIIAYFASQGALWNLYYCVLTHNMMPGFKRWGHFTFFAWIFPVSIPVMLALGAAIFRQIADREMAFRRVIVLLTPLAFCSLLYSYCPDVTRQDDLPYLPLAPLVALPLWEWLVGKLGALRWSPALFRYAAPAVCVIEIICIWCANNLRTNRFKVTSNSIRDVLLLTKPGDYVMDAESGYIFRNRPDYWVYETMTKARIRSGLIHDDVPACLERTATPMCDLYSCHILPETTRFIMENYIPFDTSALDLGVAGKELVNPDANKQYAFDVNIPGLYAVVSEKGSTAGSLDGTPLNGPRKLAVGHHLFVRTGGAGRAAIFLNEALETGFHPLFNEGEKLLKGETARGALAQGQNKV